MIAILERVAAEQKHVQTMPAPRAVVETFTPANIEFSLSVALTDVNAGDRVKSNLHIAILEAFREAGIYGTLH